MITSYNPRRQEDAKKQQQILQGKNIDHLNVQHYNLALHRAVEEIPVDTRDSNGSVDCQARGTSGTSVCQARGTSSASVWESASSVEELAEKCDDSLLASLDISSQGDESLMGTALSPVSRLYKLLVESQEMINSLEKKSSVPKGVELEMPQTATH
ncbi:unnamed protein product [Candidula unifasciata]|uniref:Uncharacterized protein n=1 Tax=Candidula unifasciata TaxID=100452 RepID=A0A8S4A355_9EUPU|nr:unnamed protein product [Candidula unifasciata]